MARLTSILFLSCILRFPSLFIVPHQRYHQQAPQQSTSERFSRAKQNNRLWSAPAGLACLLFCVLPALPSGQTSVIWRPERQIYFKEWRALGISFSIQSP
jgi:hypothetical protein